VVDRHFTGSLARAVPATFSVTIEPPKKFLRPKSFAVHASPPHPLVPSSGVEEGALFATTLELVPASEFAGGCPSFAFSESPARRILQSLALALRTSGLRKTAESAPLCEEPSRPADSAQAVISQSNFTFSRPVTQFLTSVASTAALIGGPMSARAAAGLACGIGAVLVLGITTALLIPLSLHGTDASTTGDDGGVEFATELEAMADGDEDFFEDTLEWSEAALSPPDRSDFE
jgi:hypothetical protein